MYQAPQSPSAATVNHRIGSLDAMRALAVIAVFFFHLLEVGKVDVASAFRFGWVGVDLFYVLSGFFIGSAGLRPLDWRPRAFARNRFLRIVPAYYVSMLITIAFVTPIYLVSWGGALNILSHLFFVHNLSLSTHGGINGAYWTLGVEALFYVLIGVLAPWLRRSGKSFGLVMAAFFVITYSWRLCIYFYGSDDAFHRYFVATQLPGMLDVFALGIIVAYVHTRTDWVPEIRGRRRIALGIAAIVTCASAYVYLTRHAGNYWMTLTAITFWRTWIAAGFAMAILFLLSWQSDVFDRFLRWSMLRYTGEISYSIYLYHLPVILSVTVACEEAGLGTLASASITMITTWLVAAISYHLVERRWHHRAPAPDRTE